MLSDPYRTLGLEPGASQAEIKRAYRRLAKAFHPDSAGPAALPRFLSIQQAYEDLTAGRTRVVRGGGGPTPTPERPPEPWRADPERARRAREAAREAARRRAAGARADASDPGDAGGASRRRGAEAQPPGGPGGSPGGSPGPAGKRPSEGAGPRRSGSRPRTTRKATLGSTSYDEAREQADRAWGGASWYGPASGEYWTVNPREYADPRKHGPEYQARGRRLRTAPTGSAGSEDVDLASSSEPGIDGVFETGPGTPGGAAADPGGTPPAGERWGFERATRSGSGWTGAARAHAANPADVHSPARPERAARPRAETAPRAEPQPRAQGRWDIESRSDADALRRPPPDAHDPLRRLGVALVAWPPLAIVVATLVGDLTGCATFQASCSGSAPLLPWLGQAILLGILLVAPSLTRILAVGTIAVLLALIPISGTLVALGANLDPLGRPALAFLLLIAWLAGVGFAITTRLRTGSLS